ncbi:speract receptor [Strongylocentrotus purpuratus]|uniref:Guanylate cyclase n=1 Tax=Strongylocentrotus purpuratus TaxID=7668 RepID=A0A7M7NQH8_STRPU|nr:speract receptor [Strongylocentrotus purpuratus]
MRAIVRETYEHTRIYIFIGELWEVYELLHEMMYHGLLENGEYMVIWANQENFDYKQLHLFQGDPYLRQPSREVMMYYRTLLALFLSPATDPSYDNFQRKTYKKLQEPPFNFDFGDAVDVLGIPIEAAYLYDNVYNVYAPALNETLAAGYDIRNGTEILRRILCRKHASITGRPKYIDARGDAYADITVIAVKLGEDVDETFGYIMHPVATIKITNSTPEVEQSCLGNGTSFQWVYEPINGTFIPWISGSVPLAVPTCGFYGEFCDTPYRPIVEIVSGVVGGLLLVILIVAITVYRNWKYEQELASLLWKIDYADIQTKRHNGSTISAISKLSLMTTDSKNSVDPYRCQIFTEVGTYKNMLVAIKKIHKRHVDLTRSVRKELKIIRDLRHPHLNQFIGACVDPPNICTITEYCPKGSLQDILENDEVKLDSMFIASLIGDILKGLSCLHASETHSHGNLKSSNLVVDSRWVLKITDFGLHQFRSGSRPPEIGEHAKYEKLLWRAPELLRDPAPRPEGTQKGDMYSLGIILYEMATRQGPYGKCVLGPKEIVDKVTHPLDPNTPFRPNVMEVDDCPNCMLTGMQECWNENPDERPEVKTLTTRLKPLQKGMKPNILDNMIVIMEKYANNLEDIVEDRTHQLIEEKKKTDNLLHQMLPKPVANQLKRGMQVVPESFECVTIFFSDIVGFTSLSSESTPFEVVDMLNDLYTLFDEIISYYDVYKVETIGDAYMLVSGLPLRNEKKHAAEIASTSLHLLEDVKAFKVRHRPEVNLKLRIGIHSGSTVSGVVGLTMPRYCLFGDTVNTASRMESNGEALKIHTSSETKNLLEQMGGFVVEERGLISMKGKGQLVTYWLISADPSYRRSSPFRTAEENATVGLFDSTHGNHSNRHSKISAQPQKEPFAKRLEADGRPANPNVCRDVMKPFPDQPGVDRQRPHSMFAPGSHGGTPNHFPNSTLIDFSQLNNSNENSPKVTDRLLGHLDRNDSGEAKVDLSSCTNSLLDKRQRLNDSALDYSSRNSNSQIKEGFLDNEVETVV